VALVRVTEAACRCPRLENTAQLLASQGSIQSVTIPVLSSMNLSKGILKAAAHMTGSHWPWPGTPGSQGCWVRVQPAFELRLAAGRGTNPTPYASSSSPQQLNAARK